MSLKSKVTRKNIPHDMAKIKIAIVDNQKLFRKGLISLLSEYNLFDMRFEASNGVELLDKFSTYNPEIVCLDIEMPVMNGIAVLPILKYRYPNVKIIYLCQYDEEEFILHLIRHGGNGYLLKDTNIDTVVDALLAVHLNKYYFDCKLPKLYIKKMIKQHVITPNFKKCELSLREQEILKLICSELISREIAAKLFISERTVDRHRENILMKIGARNAYGLVMYGIKHGLV
jgi:DNA-binding NarL/FixJ family response regulator